MAVADVAAQLRQGGGAVSGGIGKGGGCAIATTCV
ncbi:hypothetical protein BTH_I2083 [Burkholderia thailandensis E264]|uniref:Uncharacterized protein n=1 Tax=Burkholderia thailandensis (strain ATCC 700388 / DSM 13276 / CCUG 48851 / CIP 106301 / E264) TaxID=271848 RepID=Q2SWU2_BURTA|nr:hypothetical protein BTH_I2083 [Burkholderia thailandensis E264]